MEKLYNYLLWYNPYEKTWYAVERDSYMEFFSGNLRDKAKYIQDEFLPKLIEKITK